MAQFTMGPHMPLFQQNNSQTLLSKEIGVRYAVKFILSRKASHRQIA